MIRFCSCTKNSSSPLENPKQREGSKSCKICGGKLLVHGRGAQQGSMLSNGGLELSRVIDPQLSWKTASNGRQRAVRRARTSFTGANINNLHAKGLKPSKDLTDKESKSTEDMPVSESEKVGVSILGRRFRDTLGSVPIKKRKCMLSPSPPHHSPSYSGYSGHILERKTALNQVTVLKLHSVDPLTTGSVLGEEKDFGSLKTDSRGVHEKICDSADFSGISILAAAACDSNIAGEFMNVECSLQKVHSSEVGGIAKEDTKSEPHEKEDVVPHTSEDLGGRTDLPFDSSSSSVLPSKASNEVKSDGSCNQDTSVNSFPNVHNEISQSSSRDVRFHWDLNTVADAWEGHDEVLNSIQEATNNVNEDADHKEKVEVAEPFMDQVGFGDAKHPSTDDSKIIDTRVRLAGGEQEVTFTLEMKIEEKPGMLIKDSAAQLIFSNVGDNPAQDHRLKDAKSDVAVINEETTSFIRKHTSCSAGDIPSPILVPEVAVADSSLSSDVVLEEGIAEADHADFPPRVEAKNSSSCLVSSDDTLHGHPPNVSASNPETDRNLIEAGTVPLENISQTGNFKVGTHESACVDSGTVMINGDSFARFPEKCHDMQADNRVTGYMILGANEDINMGDETGCDNTANSREKDECACEAAAAEGKSSSADARHDDIDMARNDILTDMGCEVSDGKSIGIAPGYTDASPASSSQGARQNETDGSTSNSGQVALENHLQKECRADASQNDPDQEPGMEKVEFLGDDDSQYEDGEFRESLANCWLDDGEEGETEHVDYGTDRDTDICDAVSDFSSVNRQVNNGGLLDASQDIEHRDVGKDIKNTSRPFLNCSSSANVSDSGPGKRNAGSATGTGSHGNRTAGDDDCDDGFFKEADDVRRASHSANFRKMSGWDRLPGGCRGFGNGVSDSRSGSIPRNHTDASPGRSRAIDSMNRVSGSSLRRDDASQVGRGQSSDISRRNDKSYGRCSRSSDRNGFNPRMDRDRDDPRSIGRSGPSMHLQGRGRGDHWVEPSNNHHGNNRHDSSAYYGSASFSHHGSRNAAAAAVAKVESNGFIVAPDGTIVKAGGAGSAGPLTRRSVKGPSQNTHRSPMGRGSPIERERSFDRCSGPGRSREMSPDRPLFAGRGKRRYGPGMDGTGRRERYRVPMSEGIIDSSSLHHRISRRDHSLSPPHRRPLHLSRSHSRSPSRSRTRSPHRWASPRGRSDHGMNGGPGLRQRSRSPNFKSDTRMDRSRAHFGERVISYASLSRNHTSPTHASRWIDGRKESLDHFRDYDYRRYPGRSSPARVFSRGHKFDLMDSPGRLKPGEYCRPTNSGRFPEFVGYGRGSRHDGKSDDRREQGDRYDMLQSARQFIDNGNMKRPRYDANGFLAQNPGPKSSEFQRKESPSAFGRGTDRQLEDSPRRSNEEKGHLRNDREGNDDANFKSFGVRDGDDNMDAQRRPL